MHPLLRSAIVEHRKRMRPGQRKASRNAKFTWKYPHRAEKYAEVYLSKLFANLVGPSVLYLKQHIPDYEMNRGVLRIDTSNTDILESIDSFYMMATSDVDKEPDKNIEETIAIIIALLLSEWDRFSTQYSGSSFPVVANLDLYKQDLIAQLRKMLADEISKFYQAIKTLLSNTLAEHSIYQKVYTVIFERFKRLVITRAKYIARNFVGNAQSILSQALFTAAGFPEYIWNVNMDEVLRGNPEGKYANKIPSHFVMSGIICKWANDGIYSLDGNTWQPRTSLMEFKAPGRAPNCRCYAIPFIKSDLLAIDNAK